MSRPDRHQCSWPGCDRSYGKRAKMEEHMRSHTNTRPFCCTRCTKTFLRRAHCDRHEACVHGPPDGAPERAHACPAEGCARTFGLKHHLTRHLRIHVEPRPYPCGAVDAAGGAPCTESFGKRWQLRRHQQARHPTDGAAIAGARVYLCGGCADSFPKWSLAVAHRRECARAAQARAGEQAVLACGECGKAFGKRRHLQAHVRNVHASLRGAFVPHGGVHAAHVCTLGDCARAPASADGSCVPGGGRPFSSRSALKVHIATVHEKRKPYACTECDGTFGHKHLLARHVRAHRSREAAAAAAGAQRGPTEAAQPHMVVEQLTGSAYARERCIACPAADCTVRCVRPYDMARHVAACHAVL